MLRLLLCGSSPTGGSRRFWSRGALENLPGENCRNLKIPTTPEGQSGFPEGTVSSGYLAWRKANRLIRYDIISIPFICLFSRGSAGMAARRHLLALDLEKGHEAGQVWEAVPLSRRDSFQ